MRVLVANIHGFQSLHDIITNALEFREKVADFLLVGGREPTRLGRVSQRRRTFFICILDLVGIWDQRHRVKRRGEFQSYALFV